MMKVLQTIGGFGAKSGGTSTCTYELISAIDVLTPKEVLVDLLTPDVTDPTDRLMGHGERWIKAVANDCRTPVALSRNVGRALEASDYDVYHTNGMWLYANHKTCAVARAKGRPYVITPHGMLYPEALARSAWKKWPMRRLWFDRDVAEASCIHATCVPEMEHVRALGYRGPVALIGNPVAVPDYTERLMAGRQTDHPFWGVAFLGRLHPRKKVENLLSGVATASSSNVEVYILGQGDAVYERFLRSEAERLGLTDRVHFVGFVRDRAKFELLARMDALFVPSDMENFGMIIPEALIVGTPVMASLGTPWQALNDERCGWWRDNSPQSIAAVIDELYSLSARERLDMGRRGRDYVVHTYSSAHIAAQMVALYQWMGGNAPKPDFVYE